jgi:hypothetical protein
MTDTGTESLPHYDVEVTPISSINYAELKKATIDALKQFQTGCRENLPDEFTTYLNSLIGEIDSTYKAHELHIASSSSSSSSFKPIPKPVSKQMSKNEVKEFISKETDAVFLVTGGSFNPPHNGHIRMFETAYKRLMDIQENKGKTVYGVMVPAPDTWIEGKLCKTLLNKTYDDCSREELSKDNVKADIELKRITLENRVNLCNLSCDSFKWDTKFSAENMIIVTDGLDAPGKSIILETKNTNENVYYLCGSDYYAKTHPTGGTLPDYKFVCILRKEDAISSETGRSGKHIITLKSESTMYPVEDNDIVIDAQETDDTEASSTRLRKMLEELKDISLEDENMTTKLNEPIKSDLLTKEVYCELLKMSYIVGNNSVKISEFLDCKSSGNDTNAILKGKDGVTSNGRRSLCNIGNMCYMNAALQLMYSMTEFKTKNNNNIPENPLMQYLTAMDSKEVNCASANKLATDLYNFAQKKGFVKDRPIKQQEDPAELMTVLFGSNTFNSESIRFNIIDSVHTTTTTDSTNKEACRRNINVITHPNYHQIPTNIKDNIIYIPGTSQPRYIHILPIPTTDTFFNQIDLLSVTQIPTSDTINFLETDGCKSIGKETISTQSVIIPGNQQQYFIISLNRFDSTNNKIKTRIDLTNAEITFDSIKFKIKGCICHHGPSPQGGHYTYVEFETGTPKTVYDDTNICPYNTYINIESFKDRTVDVTGYVLLFEKEK